MKKLVILGNGFDLGSGLPTSYKDYFKYYNSKNSKTLTIIEEFLNMDLTKYISYYPPSVGQSQLKAAKRSEKLSEYTKFISQFDTDKTISIWDLYFWYSGFFLQKSNDNWSDVESQISYLINNISTITFINYDQQSDDIETILYNFTKFISTQCDIFKYICATILMNRYGAICESEYLGIFKRELNLFEENFREYIANISETQIYGSRKNIGIYRDNFFKVTASKKSDFFVLNFNYTDFSSKQKKESVLIIRNKEEIKVEQMNVHGVYYSKVIFGIDQTEQEQERFYPFTKTYRKMELYNEIPVIKMPEPQDIDEIIIYGHSLSTADYSYFHSIFDYYDIYGSNIIVSFTYSLYDESRAEELKNNHVRNIMKLLRFYGDKMFDRERGKNLVHKMLLENRLRIREVTLDPLEKL